MYYEDADGKKVYTLQVFEPVQSSLWLHTHRLTVLSLLVTAENLANGPAMLVSSPCTLFTR